MTRASGPRTPPWPRPPAYRRKGRRMSHCSSARGTSAWHCFQRFRMPRFEWVFDGAATVMVLRIVIAAVHTPPLTPATDAVCPLQGSSRGHVRATATNKRQSEPSQQIHSLPTRGCNSCRGSAAIVTLATAERHRSHLAGSYSGANKWGAEVTLQPDARNASGDVKMTAGVEWRQARASGFRRFLSGCRREFPTSGPGQSE